ncbi:LysR family transcriptional regulator [Rhizobium straminoryzae]|uniref:LysR family transcriptional regulator n=1 Tax=Rhizobium straminoryzae TaxID=1387186 RepID=A0A549T4K3_9HYPH|nr:LysR family transcriptional regulator [Rhizobium straminoryzae]TRL36764.1 LysR family transcriptional regulator [Rhizobium straminoryzae]
MKNVSWDIYAAFLEVARRGGLSGAVQATGLSPASLGRRMLDLEAEIGRPLFLRSRTGYRLTGEGEALFAQCLEMEAAARRIESWNASGLHAPLVRIACGTWMAWHLMRHWPQLCRPDDRFRLDIFIGEQRAALAHRESDIGIRAFEPAESNLAATRLGEVAYAAYRARSLSGTEASRWLAVGEEAAISAYLRYPREHHAEHIAVTVSRPRSLLDLVLAGAGIAVLPCFVGDALPELVRQDGEVAALRHSQWIVMNNEDRGRREIRTVIDRMTRLVRDEAALFAGERPNA